MVFTGKNDNLHHIVIISLSVFKRKNVRKEALLVNISVGTHGVQLMGFSVECAKNELIIIIFSGPSPLDMNVKGL